MSQAVAVSLYACYALFLVVLVLILRSIKSTWQLDTGERTDCQGFGPAITLRQAAGRFLGHLCPKLLLAGATTWWLIRVALGNWSWHDVVITAGLVLTWPLMEWLTHYWLLHRGAIKVFGREFEPIFVYTHRVHHRNPWNPELGLAVPYVIAIYVLGPPLPWSLVVPFPQAMTGAAVVTSLLLNYEWVHFLIHTYSRETAPKPPPRGRLPGGSNCIHRYLWISCGLVLCRGGRRSFFSSTGSRETRR